MKSTVVDESLSSFKPMYCSREYHTSTRLNQQYEKFTLKLGKHTLTEDHEKGLKNTDHGRDIQKAMRLVQEEG